MLKTVLILVFIASANLSCSKPDYENIIDRQQKKMNEYFPPDSGGLGAKLPANGSFKCQFSLLHQNAVIGPNGSYDPRYFLNSANYCAGPTQSGRVLAGVKQRVPLYGQNVFLSVDIKYIEKTSATSQHISDCRMQIHYKSEKAFIPYSDEFYYNLNGRYFNSGSTFDQQYQYVVQCDRVSFCEE